MRRVPALLDPDEACSAVYGIGMCSAGAVRAVVVHRWDDRIQAELESIEVRSFREELRYTTPEMAERASRRGFECLFLYDRVGPSAVVILYDYPPQSTRRLPTALPPGRRIYLDTLVVREPGQGVGTKLLRNVLDRFSHERVAAVLLDTERRNEAGHGLVAYYERFGFTIVDEDRESGNVTMALIAPARPSRPFNSWSHPFPASDDPEQRLEEHRRDPAE
jgi:GNAT superfamily N-acetyltransferase